MKCPRYRKVFHRTACAVPLLIQRHSVRNPAWQHDPFDAGPMAIARGLHPSGSRSVFLREYFERQYFCQIHDVLFQFDDVASYQRVEQFVGSRARSTRYIACSIITIPRTLHGLNDLCRANR